MFYNNPNQELIKHLKRQAYIYDKKYNKFRLSDPVPKDQHPLSKYHTRIVTAISILKSPYFNHTIKWEEQSNSETINNLDSILTQIETNEHIISTNERNISKRLSLASMVLGIGIIIICVAIIPFIFDKLDFWVAIGAIIVPLIIGLALFICGAACAIKTNPLDNSTQEDNQKQICFNDIQQFLDDEPPLNYP